MLVSKYLATLVASSALGLAALGGVSVAQTAVKHVTIIDSGDVVSLSIWRGSVQDALHNANIDLTGKVVVSPAADDPVRDGLVIVVLPADRPALAAPAVPTDSPTRAAPTTPARSATASSGAATTAEPTQTAAASEPPRVQPSTKPTLAAPPAVDWRPTIGPPPTAAGEAQSDQPAPDTTAATTTPQPSATATPQPSATATPQPSATATPQPSGAATPQPSDAASQPSDAAPEQSAGDQPSGAASSQPAAAPVPSAAGPTTRPTAAAPASPSQAPVVVASPTPVRPETDRPTISLLPAPALVPQAALPTAAAQPSPPPADSCVARLYNQGLPSADGPITAAGEPFAASGLTAAHRDLPFGTIVQITNLANGQSVEVRVNDRGAYSGGQCFNLTVMAYSLIAPLGTPEINVVWSIV
ncbi:MAG: ubiquitin-like domain-containing protein [Propionibacteriaceae bacterium]|jgi:hypothetical protein|nr:ubiquitin-like domain-containing protein [Propionibacteriaceae bacterium]